ncbi:DUF3885 domain-containing protein [Shimazuella kribbensis]
MKEFLNAFFPQLSLEPPLFYSWNTGIRFQLGEDYDREQIDNTFKS